MPISFKSETAKNKYMYIIHGMGFHRFGGSGFVVFDLFSAHGRSTIQRFKLKYHKKLLNLVFYILMKKNYSSSSIQSNII